LLAIQSWRPQGVRHYQADGSAVSLMLPLYRATDLRRRPWVSLEPPVLFVVNASRVYRLSCALGRLLSSFISSLQTNEARVTFKTNEFMHGGDGEVGVT
jgi:hypothetical protein